VYYEDYGERARKVGAFIVLGAQQNLVDVLNFLQLRSRLLFGFVEVLLLATILSSVYQKSHACCTNIIIDWLVRVACSDSPSETRLLLVTAKYCLDD
jgi:hypothetical protein